MNNLTDWSLYLQNAPLPWLLEPTVPSIRFWTLRDILDRPTGDPELAAAQTAVDQQPLVQELLASQHPDGHWGEEAAKPYNTNGAVTILSLLYSLGATPNAQTAAGCDSLLANCQNACGGFSLNRNLKSGIFPCTTAEMLPMLVYFGLGQDARVLAAFNFLLETYTGRQDLDCGRYQHQACLWGAIALLKALCVLPDALRSPRSEALRHTMANTLLDAAYDFEGEHKRWLTFGVPRAWDLLSALLTLAQAGYAHHPHFDSFLERVLACQDASGRWPCGSASRTWPLEKRGQPSRWVTLDVLRVLKIRAEN